MDASLLAVDAARLLEPALDLFPMGATLGEIERVGLVLESVRSVQTELSQRRGGGVDSVDAEFFPEPIRPIGNIAAIFDTSFRF